MSERRDTDERATQRRVGVVVLAFVAAAAVAVGVSYARRFEKRRHVPSSSASAVAAPSASGR